MLFLLYVRECSTQSTALLPRAPHERSGYDTGWRLHVNAEVEAEPCSARLHYRVAVGAPRSHCEAVESNLIGFPQEGPASSTGPGGISEDVPAGTSRPGDTLGPGGRSTSMAQTRSRRSPYQSGVAVSPSIVMPAAAR